MFQSIKMFPTNCKPSKINQPKFLVTRSSVIRSCSTMYKIVLSVGSKEQEAFLLWVKGICLHLWTALNYRIKRNINHKRLIANTRSQMNKNRLLFQGSRSNSGQPLITMTYAFRTKKSILILL